MFALISISSTAKVVGSDRGGDKRSPLTASTVHSSAMFMFICGASTDVLLDARKT